MDPKRLVVEEGIRAPPYPARQMSRVETRTPGVTDVLLPYLFGNGAGGVLLWPLLGLVVEKRGEEGWMNNTMTRIFTQV